MRRLLLALALLAGCTARPSPVVVPVTPRPVVEVEPRAERLLRQIAAGQKLPDPWWVRLSVVWEPDPRIEVHLDRQPPGPADFAAAAGGLNVVLARDLLPYLTGSRFEFVETDKGIGFDVTFPNQDAADREAAGRWLREERARRKAGETPRPQGK